MKSSPILATIVLLTTPVMAHGLIDHIEVLEPGLTATVYWAAVQVTDPNDPCGNGVGEDEAKQAVCSEWVSHGTKRYIGTDAAGSRYFVGRADNADGLYFGVYRENQSFWPAGGDELIVRVVRDVQPAGDASDEVEGDFSWSAPALRFCQQRLWPSYLAVGALVRDR